MKAQNHFIVTDPTTQNFGLCSLKDIALKSTNLKNKEILEKCSDTRDVQPSALKYGTK